MVDESCFGFEREMKREVKEIAISGREIEFPATLIFLTLLRLRFRSEKWQKILHNIKALFSQSSLLYASVIWPSV